MKRLLIALLALVAAGAAQSLPEAPSATRAGAARVQGYFAGGFIYNVRETDTGIAAEVGATVRGRFGAAIGFHDMLSDNYHYRELQLLGRWWIAPSFGVEGGMGLGLSCIHPTPALCDFYHAHWRAPFGGAVYRQKIRRHLDALVRLDVTRTQLPPTGGKDDGVRLQVLLAVHP